jgi:hypothetical protein
MTQQFQDTISPIAKTIGDEPRSAVIKRCAAGIRDIYDENSGKFKGMSSVFKENFLWHIERNLWELCYFMIESTAYSIPAPFYKTCLAKAKKEGSTTFMYALMDYAFYSGIQVFPEIDSNKQREHLANITTPIYGVPIGSFMQDERERMYKGI